MMPAPYLLTQANRPPKRSAVVVSVLDIGESHLSSPDSPQTRRESSRLAGVQTRPDCMNVVDFAAAHRPVIGGSPLSPLAVEQGGLTPMRCSEVRCVSSFERSKSCSAFLSAICHLDGGASNMRHHPGALPPSDNNITKFRRKEINFERNRQMANLEHPIDAVVMDFAALKHELAAEFMEDDGVICEREAAILIRFEEGKRRIGRARALERATQLAMKQEGRFSDYTNQQFALAGIRLTPIDPDAA